MDQAFVVCFQAAMDRQRPYRLLDFPALWQQHEALGEIGAFDDFHDPVACRLDRLDEAGLIAAVNDRLLNPWA